MSDLEKYIKDHQEEFDSTEPEPGHLRRFEDRLAEQPGMKLPRFNRPLLLKIAALIIILISVSVFIFEFATREIRDRFAHESQAAELPSEILEAVQYYDNQTITQLATIHKLAFNNSDAEALSSATLKDIRSLDASTDELKKSLAQNPGNEHILDAIVRNQQMKENMLNTIITQISNSKK
jgi:hypothetical protein